MPEISRFSNLPTSFFCKVFSTVEIFATKYLISDFYLDHVEPQIATVSWFFEYGKEIYNKTTDYERYSLIFGPITYYSNYIAMKFLGASIISSKVVSFLFLNLTLLISYLTVLKITKNIECFSIQNPEDMDNLT